MLNLGLWPAFLICFWWKWIAWQRIRSRWWHHLGAKRANTMQKEIITNHTIRKEITLLLRDPVMGRLCWMCLHQDRRRNEAQRMQTRSYVIHNILPCLVGLAHSWPKAHVHPSHSHHPRQTCSSVSLTLSDLVVLHAFCCACPPHHHPSPDPERARKPNVKRPQKNMAEWWTRAVRVFGLKPETHTNTRAGKEKT